MQRGQVAEVAGDEEMAVFVGEGADYGEEEEGGGEEEEEEEEGFGFNCYRDYKFVI